MVMIEFKGWSDPNTIEEKAISQEFGQTWHCSDAI
jgi:hypothetical protein